MRCGCAGDDHHRKVQASEVAGSLRYVCLEAHPGSTMARSHAALTTWPSGARLAHCIAGALSLWLWLRERRWTRRHEDCTISRPMIGEVSDRLPRQACHILAAHQTTSIHTKFPPSTFSQKKSGDGDSSCSGGQQASGRPAFPASFGLTVTSTARARPTGNS
jgi:hypothetical protein